MNDDTMARRMQAAIDRPVHPGNLEAIAARTAGSAMTRELGQRLADATRRANDLDAALARLRDETVGVRAALCESEGRAVRAERSRDRWRAGVFLALAAAGMALLFGCSMPTRDPMLAALEQHQSDVANATAEVLSLVAPVRADANIRVLYPPPPNCAATRPHPFLVAGVNADSVPLSVVSGPVVGREFRVTFWTCALPEAVDDAAAWIAVGHTPSTPVQLPALAGCWAMVAPEAQIPVGIAPGWQGALRREPATSGRIDLRWTPSPAAAGSRVYLQLLVFRPGITPTGFDVSAGVELTVGS